MRDCTRSRLTEAPARRRRDKPLVVPANGHPADLIESIDLPALNQGAENHTRRGAARFGNERGCAGTRNGRKAERQDGNPCTKHRHWDRECGRRSDRSNGAAHRRHIHEQLGRCVVNRGVHGHRRNRGRVRPVPRGGAMTCLGRVSERKGMRRVVRQRGTVLSTAGGSVGRT